MKKCEKTSARLINCFHSEQLGLAVKSSVTQPEQRDPNTLIYPQGRTQG